MEKNRGGENLLQVRKRDDREVGYDEGKVFHAIEKAYLKVRPGEEYFETVEKLAKKVTKSVKEQYENNVTVDEVQEVVKDVLLHTWNKDVAKEYIEYATERKTRRDSSMDLTVQIEKLLSGDKEVINANANKDSKTFSTYRDLLAGQVSKAPGLKMLPKRVRYAHIRGDLHFHDLDYSPMLPYTNCCLVALKEMLRDGFTMGNAVIESPKSIQTAVAQTSQIVANVASSQFGGTSLNRLDEVLEPYAWLNYEKHLQTAEYYGYADKERYAMDLTKKDIYDSMQSFEYEVNTLYTSNGQTPFTTASFGLSESWIGKEIQKAILNVRINGLGKNHKTAIFPKLLFTLKDGLNLHPNEPNYDIKKLALKCSSLRVYPDILNYDTLIKLTGSFKGSMGCRSFLQGWVDPETGEQVDDGRMNLGM